MVPTWSCFILLTSDIDVICWQNLSVHSQMIVRDFLFDFIHEKVASLPSSSDTTVVDVLKALPDLIKMCLTFWFIYMYCCKDRYM